MAISAGALRAGKAVIELGLMTKGVEKQLSALQDRLKTVASSFTRIGTFGVVGGGFAGLRNLFIGSAGATAAAWPVKLAANIELASAQLSTFTGSAESAQKMMLDLQKFSAKAMLSMQDLGSAARLLMSRDIKSDDAVTFTKALSALAAGDLDQFQSLVKAFADVRGATKLTGEEVRQFKNTAFNPINEIARMTGESVEVVEARARDGAVSFGEVANALMYTVGPMGRFHGILDLVADTLIGKMLRALAEFKNAVLPIGNQLLQPLKNVFDIMIGLMPELEKFIRANSGFAKTALGLVAVVAGIAVAFTTVGLAMHILAIASAGVVTAFALLTTTIGALIGLPGLLAAGFVYLAYKFFTATKAGRSMVQYLAGAFTRLKTIATTTFKGITDAISGGETELAAKVLWAGLKLAWLEGTHKLTEIWTNFKDVGIRTFIELIFDIQEHWTNMISFLTTMWDDFTIKFNRAWVRIRNNIQNAADDIAGAGRRGAIDEMMEQMTMLEKERDRIMKEGTSLSDPFGGLTGIEEKMETLRSALEPLMKEELAAAQRKVDRAEERRATFAGGTNAAAIEEDRKRAIEAINAARKEAQAFQDDRSNEEMGVAERELADAKKELARLTKEAADAAKKGTTGDPTFDKVKNFMTGAMATAKEIASAKPQAFLDTRLAAQMVGNDQIDRQQLDELKKIRGNTERPGGIPVV